MWNYRVFKDQDNTYSLREAFYLDKRNKQKVTAWTKGPAVPEIFADEVEEDGDPVEKLRWVLTSMLAALDEEVIDEAAQLALLKTGKKKKAVRKQKPAVKKKAVKKKSAVGAKEKTRSK